MVLVWPEILAPQLGICSVLHPINIAVHLYDHYTVTYGDMLFSRIYDNAQLHLGRHQLGGFDREKISPLLKVFCGSAHSNGIALAQFWFSPLGFTEKKIRHVWRI